MVSNRGETQTPRALWGVVLQTWLHTAIIWRALEIFMLGPIPRNSDFVGLDKTGHQDFLFFIFYFPPDDPNILQGWKPSARPAS